MKKLLCIMFAIAIMLFCFTACNTGKEIESEKTNITISGQTETTKVEWEDFLNDYEDFVDEYISIFKKYKENPTDMSILSDYTELTSKVAEWSTKSKDIQDSLANTQDLSKYIDKLSKITAKLSEVR